MMMATTSHRATSLVETCLPVELYFSKGPQHSSNVMVRARMLDAHRGNTPTAVAGEHHIFAEDRSACQWTRFWIAPRGAPR
jgi:hypothetical protein